MGTKSIIIRKCATLVEAYACRGLLTARGFAASIDNSYHCAVDWSVVPALGGVSIRVPECQYKNAKKCIIEASKSGPQILEEQFGSYEHPKRYGRLSVWCFWLNYFGVIPMLLIGSIAAAVHYIPPDYLPSHDSSFFYPNYSGGVGFNFRDIADGVALMLMMIVYFISEALSLSQSNNEKEAHAPSRPV